MNRNHGCRYAATALLSGFACLFSMGIAYASWEGFARAFMFFQYWPLGFVALFSVLLLGSLLTECLQKTKKKTKTDDIEETVEADTDETAVKAEKAEKKRFQFRLMVGALDLVSICMTIWWPNWNTKSSLGIKTILFLSGLALTFHAADVHRRGNEEKAKAIYAWIYVISVILIIIGLIAL